VEFKDLIFLLVGFVAGWLVTLNNFSRMKTLAAAVEDAAEKKVAGLRGDLKNELVTLLVDMHLKTRAAFIPVPSPLPPSPPPRPDPGPVILPPPPPVPASGVALGSLVQGVPPSGVQPGDSSSPVGG
jgi:hypothetical protein